MKVGPRQAWSSQIPLFYERALGEHLLMAGRVGCSSDGGGGGDVERPQMPHRECGSHVMLGIGAPALPMTLNVSLPPSEPHSPPLILREVVPVSSKVLPFWELTDPTQLH